MSQEGTNWFWTVNQEQLTDPRMANQAKAMKAFYVGKAQKQFKEMEQSMQASGLGVARLSRNYNDEASISTLKSPGVKIISVDLLIDVPEITPFQESHGHEDSPQDDYEFESVESDETITSNDEYAEGETTSEGVTNQLGSEKWQEHKEDVIAYWNVKVGHSGPEWRNGFPTLWDDDGPPVNLGLLPGSTWGFATAVSSQGGAVVGWCEDPNNIFGGTRGFLWSQELGGMQEILDMPNGISANGKIVVGQTRGPVYTTGAYWTSETGTVMLPYEADGYSETSGISADGTTIIGGSNNRYWWKAFRYVIGVSNDLEFISDVIGCVAVAASEDGKVIVGTCPSTRAGLTFQPYYWTQETGIVMLGDRNGWGFAISQDGTTVVGQYSYPQEAFYWTKDTGMVTLPGLYGVAWGVSEDGEVIVGNSFPGGVSVATVWEKDGTFKYLDNLPDQAMAVISAVTIGTIEDKDQPRGITLSSV